MEHKEILELLSRELASSNEMTDGFLQDAVATFSTRTAAAIDSLQKLQASDPLGFALAAARLLASAPEKSRGVKYLADLMLTGNPLIDLLLNERVLGLEAALLLTRNLATAVPLLDVRLIQRLIANAEVAADAIDGPAVLRAFALVDAISDCSRVASFLIQFMGHPSAHVRSKATLLLGRANLNVARLKVFLGSEDSRVSANAVESLWGYRENSVRAILWQAAKNPHGRVVVNALLELYRWGDREAYSQLVQLAGAADPVLRSGAAWAMGESGDPEFSEPLEKLGQDGDAEVRAMAEKSRKKLQTPNSGVSPPPG
jgi:HEAT repeat protein